MDRSSEAARTGSRVGGKERGGGEEGWRGGGERKRDPLA